MTDFFSEDFLFCNITNYDTLFLPKKKKTRSKIVLKKTDLLKTNFQNTNDQQSKKTTKRGKAVNKHERQEDKCRQEEKDETRQGK